MVFDRFKKSSAQVTIQLDRPEGPYYPGDIIRASITLQTEKEMHVRQLSAGLRLWEAYITEDSEGDEATKVTIDEHVASEVLMEEEDIPSGFYQSYRVELPIPDDSPPPPCAGDRVQCRWYLTSHLDIAKKRDILEQVRLPLIVPPPGIKVQSGEYGEASHPKKVGMHLWLPRLEWVEGDIIDGKFVIIPNDSIDAQEVRIDLERHERVHAPRVKISSVSRIMKSQVVGKTRFQPNQKYDYAFDLDIPELGCPTRRTKNTTVSYTLKGVLNRRLRRDFTVSTEIELFNGSAPV